MKNLFHSIVAIFIFLILFSISIIVLKIGSIQAISSSDLIALFGANATLFGSLVIIYGFAQWKDQDNIRLSRDLALKTSEGVSDERNAIYQIYGLFKVSHNSFLQFSPDSFEKLTDDASSLFESEWENFIHASFLIEKNCIRLQRINNDAELKQLHTDYKNLSLYLSGKYEYIFNYKCQAHENPPSSNYGFDDYSNAFSEIDAKFEKFKQLSNALDEHFDQYIVLTK